MRDTIENSFGNTFVAKIPGGEVRFHFNADKSYVQFNPDGSKVNGVWSKTENKITMTPNGGAAATIDFEPNHNVGDVWNAIMADGTPTQVSLVAGR